MSGNPGSLPSPTPVETWSPSSYSQLKRCPLSLAYDRDSALRGQFRRASTFSSLGLVAHSLTERVWKGHYNSITDDALRGELTNAWDKLAYEQSIKLSGDWTPATPPQPNEWPYHAMLKQRTIRRLLREIDGFRASQHLEPGPSDTYVERWLTDEDLNLGGQPDRVQRSADHIRVVDLKSGFSVDSITDSHRLQLTLYTHLIYKDCGVMPSEIAVLTANGDLLIESITAESVGEVVTEFVERTKNFNNLVRTGGITEQIATPSAEACKWCSYRTVCPAFWSHMDSTWDSRAICGSIVSINSPRSFTLRVIRPSDDSGRNIQITASAPIEVAVDSLVSCIDFSPDTAPVRLRWNSIVAQLDGA